MRFLDEDPQFKDSDKSLFDYKLNVLDINTDL